MKEAYGGPLACLELHALTSTPIRLQLDQMEILGSDETQPVRLTFWRLQVAARHAFACGAPSSQTAFREPVGRYVHLACSDLNWAIKVHKP